MCLPKKTPINYFKMQEKVVQFPQDKTKYLSVAEKYNKEGKHLDALGFLFSALKNNPKDYEIISEIANTYADMGLSDFSNKYWFKYIDVAPEHKVSTAYEEMAINYLMVLKEILLQVQTSRPLNKKRPDGQENTQEKNLLIKYMVSY